MWTFLTYSGGLADTHRQSRSRACLLDEAPLNVWPLKEVSLQEEEGQIQCLLLSIPIQYASSSEEKERS